MSASVYAKHLSRPVSASWVRFGALSFRSLCSSPSTIAMDGASSNGLSEAPSLHLQQQQKHMQRKTRICCTIGPASEAPSPLGKVLSNGMSIMRCNFSHGQYDEQGARVENLRRHLDRIWKEQVTDLGFHGVSEMDSGMCSIAVDLKGREVRTGKLEGGKKIELVRGSQIILHADEAYRAHGTESDLFIDYPLAVAIPTINGKKEIYIDDGLITLEASEVLDSMRVKCIVRNGGILGERKGVNVPGAKFNLPAITEYDKSVLRWAAEKEVDAVFASFVESANDIVGLKEYLKGLGPNGAAMLVFSKIESQTGFDKFEEILEASDGILVARGDLGIEVPVEDVPWMQKSMISMCNGAGKPVICATQMLDSMEKRPRPTRAEASDVANAVLDGADIVMLSGETANGSYSDVVVETMGRIAAKTELMLWTEGSFIAPVDANLIVHDLEEKTRETIANAAAEAAHGSLLILPAMTGGFASKVAMRRPDARLLAPTMSRRVANKMLFRQGLKPLLLSKEAVLSKCNGDESKHNVELVMASMALEWAKKKGLAENDERAISVIATSDGIPRILTL